MRLIATSKARSRHSKEFGSFANALLILVLGSSLCCAATILIGRGARAQANALRLKTCDNHVCIYGITLGVTGWNQALTILAGKAEKSLDGGESWLHIYASPDSNVVGRLTMVLPPDGSLSMAELLFLFGNPCIVSRVKQSPFVTVHYVGMSFRVHDVNHRLNAQSPVTFLQLSETPEPNAEASCSTATAQSDELNESYPWQGLASLSRYTNSR